jgi:hypothetical protein
MERQKMERRINRSFLVQDLRSWRKLLCRKVAQLLAKLQMVGLQLSWSSCAWKPAAGEWSGCTLQWLLCSGMNFASWFKLQVCLRVELAVVGYLWLSCVKHL